MAKLFMTIDSDDEIKSKVRGNKKMPVIVSQEEEEILLSANVVMNE
jgi:hypothetical protein